MWRRAHVAQVAVKPTVDPLQQFRATIGGLALATAALKLAGPLLLGGRPLPAAAMSVIELLASASLFGGGGFGRWFGIFAASLVAIESLLQIPAYPFLSIAIFALSLWIIHGLVIYGEPEGPVNMTSDAGMSSRSTVPTGPTTPA